MTKGWTHPLEGTDKWRKASEQERVLLEVAETIRRLMEESGIRKVDLAKKLGVKQSQITKLLSGENNAKLRTLSDVFFALGRGIRLDLIALDSELVVPSTQPKPTFHRFNDDWPDEVYRFTDRPRTPSRRHSPVDGRSLPLAG